MEGIATMDHFDNMRRGLSSSCQFSGQSFVFFYREDDDHRSAAISRRASAGARSSSLAARTAA